MTQSALKKIHKPMAKTVGLTTQPTNNFQLSDEQVLEVEKAIEEYEKGNIITEEEMDALFDKYMNE
ncbi:MAG: hypothetical protein LBQ34_01790 [Alphaproteobacteria bacterium]|jgi:hypothetical protein|nr:hypothetical protein [Alphaproteobacteria bacterium]